MTAISRVLLLTAAAALAAGCVGRADDDDSQPGTLTAGAMRLTEYPVETSGVSGLAPACRRVFECGCPLLYPEDVAFCRELVWTYSEEDCTALLYNAVPECVAED